MRICRDAVQAEITDQAAWNEITTKDKHERGYLQTALDELEKRYEKEAEDYKEREGE